MQGFLLFSLRAGRPSDAFVRWYSSLEECHKAMRPDMRFYQVFNTHNGVWSTWETTMESPQINVVRELPDTYMRG